MTTTPTPVKKSITYLIEYETEEEFFKQTVRAHTPALGGVIMTVEFGDTFQRVEELEERIKVLEARLDENGIYL